MRPPRGQATHGFRAFPFAWRTIQGIEAVNMVRKATDQAAAKILHSRAGSHSFQACSAWPSVSSWFPPTQIAPWLVHMQHSGHFASVRALE
jgi:hypothetical protein